MSQIFTVILPDIGEGVVEGEVIQWLKNPGDSVKKDEPVVIIMTDKATVELPAPTPGHVSDCFYKAGDIAKVGKPIYAIATENQTNELSPPPSPTPTQKISHTTTPSPQRSTHALALPSTRHLAKEMGIDIDSIKGTGPDGRITPKDLHEVQEQVQPREDDNVEPITGVRRLMMKKMAESKKTIPHFSYFERVDATRLIKLRQKIAAEAEKESIHLTYMPFFLKALSLTISKYPKINSTIDPQNAKLHLHPHQNIGIAMALDQGLIVPVLKNIETLSLPDIIHSFESLKKKAQTNTLEPTDMREGTITISNYGVLGGDGVWATPIIQPPEVAILALAKITPMPVVTNGEVSAKNVLNLSWSFDHRIIDGHLAALVSHHFAQLIENPAALL